MKRFFIKFISRIISFWSKVYTYSLSQRLKNWSSLLYSMWLSNFLGSVGDNVSLSRPLFFEGCGSRRIRIGSNSSIGHHTVLGCWEKYLNVIYSPEITIGNNCSIGEYCHISAINKIIICDGVLTGRFVYIGDNSHGLLSKEEMLTRPSRRPLVSKGDVFIGKNVWLGDKVTVLAGVHIGDNAIVGANSVVTKDLPSNCVAAGVPARVIREI